MENIIKTLKILIVDDSEIDLDILEAILTQLGYQEIIKAGSGIEAFRMAVKNRPDLIISDILMPVVDGAELKCQLKHNPITKCIPLIFVSSIIEKNEEKKYGGMLPGGEWLIAKPYSIDEIAKAIDITFLQDEEGCNV